jgi:protein O-mannosyl-transferase
VIFSAIWQSAMNASPVVSDLPPAAESAVTSSGNHPRSANPSKSYLPLVLIVGLGLLIYLPAHNAPFIFDDFSNIVFDEGESVHRLWPWGPLPLHRAFGVWTLQLNYALQGLNPTGYRLVNIAIHLAASGVLFGLVRRGLKRPSIPWWLAENGDWLALATSLIWLVHPLQAQAVTYIIQRYESLMGLCYLLTLYCLVRGVESCRSWLWYAAAIVACWAGAATKEVMFSAPLIALLLDRAFLAASWKEILCRRWGLYLGLFATDGWLLLVTSKFMFGSPGDGAGFDQAITSWQYLRSQPAVLLYYLRIACWPDVLLLDHGWPVETSHWRIYGLGAIILALLVASFWALWRVPRLGVVAIAFFAILAPTSSFIPLADLAFDHRMYLPLASVILLVLIGVARAVSWLSLEPARRTRMLWIGIAAVVAALALRTLVRNVEFRNPIRIWENVAAHVPYRARSYVSLAKLYMDAGRLTEAAAAFDKALALDPGDSRTYTKYGHLMYHVGKYDRAIEFYCQAIKLNPSNVDAFTMIGRAEMIRGNYAAALAASREALKIRPDKAMFRTQVAWLLATIPDDQLRDGAEALRLVKDLPQVPRYPDMKWLLAYAAALAEVGQFDEAAAAQLQALNAVQSKRPDSVHELSVQLESYRDHKPWRLSPISTSPAEGINVPAGGTDGSSNKTSAMSRRPAGA